MDCLIECVCGKVQGKLKQAEASSRGVCYCKDCRAFALFLGKGSEVLDAQGGTEVIQTSPSLVNFAAGAESISCMRLSATGLLRWYASCCQTPLGNTPADYKMSFVGLIRNCIHPLGDADIDDVLGPVRMRVHTEHAIGEPPKAVGVMSTMAKFAFSIARSRLNGTYRDTPFFSSDGRAISTPKVLSTAEQERLCQLV